MDTTIKELREKVEALLDPGPGGNPWRGGWHEAIRKVLALFPKDPAPIPYHAVGEVFEIEPGKWVEVEQNRTCSACYYGDKCCRADKLPCMAINRKCHTSIIYAPTEPPEAREEEDAEPYPIGHRFRLEDGREVEVVEAWTNDECHSCDLNYEAPTCPLFDFPELQCCVEERRDHKGTCLRLTTPTKSPCPLYHQGNNQ